MRYQYISTGSNTTVKDGAGQLYGILAGGADGGTVFAVDSLGIGATPNYVTQRSDSSNLGAATLGASALDLQFFGAPFSRPNRGQHGDRRQSKDSERGKSRRHDVVPERLEG